MHLSVEKTSEIYFEILDLFENNWNSSSDFYSDLIQAYQKGRVLCILNLIYFQLQQEELRLKLLFFVKSFITKLIFC